MKTNNQFLEVLKTLAENLTKMTEDSENGIDRIILIGSHGTGKSTLAKALAEELDLPITESVARILLELKYNPDPMDYQEAVCKLSRWDFTRWKDVPNIMTRCPLDTLAYTKALSRKKNDKLYLGKYNYDRLYEEIYNRHLEHFKKDEVAMEMLKHSLFVYLPIEFKPENDGVRPIDPEYQQAVDQAMRELIYEFQITPLVVSGSVEERVEKVMDFIAKY